LSIKNISVVIIAKNASSTIKDTLDALISFGEVIVYLNHSTDNTQRIANKYGNVKIVEGDFIGFGPTKNVAATYAKNEWILSLDSDEILNQELIDEMKEIDFKMTQKLYRLKRDNYFLGYKTQDSDTIIRLYHKIYTQFNDNAVHEKVIVPDDAEVVNLKHSFKHLNITDINQTLTKIIQYTDLSVDDQKTCYFSKVLAKSFFAFIKVYLLKGNILKGWVGFALAVNAANRRYYKYLKQFIRCKKI